MNLLRPFTLAFVQTHWPLPFRARGLVVPVAFLWALLAAIASPPPPPSEPASALRSYEHRLIVLGDQVDLSAFPPPRARRLSELQAHHRRVVEALQRTARETQSGLVAQLDSLVARGEVRSYQPFWVVNVIAVEATASALQAIENRVQVASTEADPTISLVTPEVEPANRALDDIPAPIGLRTIRAPEVWAVGVTGAGILLANFDSGVNGTHPALVGHWRGSYGVPAAQCWLDLAGSTAAPTDVAGHGTQTMSILCGLTPGDTLGVAWGARYIAARLDLSSGASLVSTALSAFQWAIDPDGNAATFDDVPRVISCSWGFEAGAYPACYDALNTAVDACEAADIAIFWAAGNEGDLGASTVRVPADHTSTEANAFAVGAYDYTIDSVWYRSSRGPSLCATDPELRIKPELVAPGRNVRTAVLGTSYAYGTGTSYAAPHAAGVAALMLEVNPTLSPDSLKKILLLTAVDMGSPGNDNDFGYGKLDAYCAVMAAAGGVGWVSGTVTDVYGWPAEATVKVTGHPQWTRCDAHGRFVLAMPAQMPFVLRAQASAFDTFTQSITLSPGDTLDLELALMLASNCGYLSGTVINCLSEPAVGATVTLSAASQPPVTTDDEGRFRQSVLAGTYTVFAADGYCATASVGGVGVVGRGLTDIEIVLPPNPAYQCSPPDPSGYRACDNMDPGGPAYVWNEIDPAQGGRGIVYNLGEDASLWLIAPFPITFYGLTRERFYLNANGNLSLLRTFAEYTNTPLPRGVTPLICPFWDDLSDPYGGDICALYEPAAGTLTIEWSAVPRYGGEGNETFELVIYDPAVYPTSSGNAMLEYRYHDLAVTDESTVGVEGPPGSGYLQYVFNGTYAENSCSLRAGRTIRIGAGELLPVTPQLALQNPFIGLTLETGQQADTALILVNSGTGPASYAVTSEAPLAGYTWASSRGSGGPAYEFTDIASIGENIGIARDDTTTDPIRLPWCFPFYGCYFDRLTVCSNGYVSFNSGSFDRSCTPAVLSDQHDPYYALVPYWADLDITTGGAVLKYFDAVRDRFIIQWNQVRRYHANGPNTFQVVLNHDGTIEMVYQTMSSPLNNGTVGIKGRNTSEYLQLAYRQSFLQSNMLVRISRPDTLPAVCLVPDAPQGVVPAASTLRVPLRLMNRSVSFAQRTWNLTVRSSDPQATALTAQVVMDAVPSAGDLHVVIAPDPDGIRLSWNRVPAPRYCIYSGTVADAPLPRFEASVTDTSVVLPYRNEVQCFFEVRLCDQ
jgi:subtilisin family serine protease